MMAKTLALTRLRNPRHLSSKLAMDLVLAAAIGLLAILLFTRQIVTQNFDALERREIQTNISRLKSLLANQKQSVQAKAIDWGTWSDAYNYVSKNNTSFVDDNLNTTSISNLDVSSISYVRFDGSLNNSWFVDLQSKRDNPGAARLLERYVGSKQVIERAMRQERFQTFVQLNDKLLVVAFSHVRRNDSTGPSLGFAVIGREIEPKAISQQLQQPTSSDFERIATPIQIELLDHIAKISVSIADIADRPIATIRFAMRRDIHEAGTNLLLIVGSGIVVLLFAMLALLNRRLKRSVVDPLVRIEKHVRRIGHTKELLCLPENPRRDEIGSLSDGLNEMTGQLIELRSELEAQSFELGKNQSAIGVMHNIRNGLAPAFTILSRMHEQFHVAGQENVTRAITELQDSRLPVERRKKLSDFISAAMHQYENQLGICRTNAREAGRSLATVLEAIAQVQTEDRASPEITDCNVAEAIASALFAARHTDGSDIDVEYDPDPSAPTVRANRTLLSQIIVNLLTNAVESINETQRGDGKIRIKQSVVNFELERVFRISFEDNGEGFDPTLVPRLFERNFSTRTGKTGGLGLHWCANTVTAMGGTLSLISRGMGEGATATIHLPTR